MWLKVIVAAIKDHYNVGSRRTSQISYDIHNVPVSPFTSILHIIPHTLPLRTLSEEASDAATTQPSLSEESLLRFDAAWLLQQLLQNVLTDGGAALATSGTPQQRAFSLLSCKVMARLGRQEVLEYFYAQDSAWDEWTCMVAAQGGHLKLLRWLREWGCSYFESVMCGLAATNGDLSML